MELVLATNRRGSVTNVVALNGSAGLAMSRGAAVVAISENGFGPVCLRQSNQVQVCSLSHRPPPFLVSSLNRYRHCVS